MTRRLMTTLLLNIHYQEYRPFLMHKIFGLGNIRQEHRLMRNAESFLGWKAGLQHDMPFQQSFSLSKASKQHDRSNLN